MHRIGWILLTGLTLSGIIGSTASASSIQWTSGPTVVLQGNSVTASGTMVGLAPGTVRIALTVRGRGAIVCTNPSGRVAVAQTRYSVPVMLRRVKSFKTTGSLTFTLGVPVTQSRPQQLTACSNRNWLTAPTYTTFTSARLAVRQNGQVLFSQAFRL